MPTLVEEIDEAIGWVQYEYGFVTDVLRKCKAHVEAINRLVSEELDQARTEAHESGKDSPNSYGAGYDQGYYDALYLTSNTLKGE